MTESTSENAASPLRYERVGGVATLTLDRPEVLNALTAGSFRELERRLVEIEADEAVRVVVLTGAGRGFSAGADLRPVPKAEAAQAATPAFPGDPGGDILERANRVMRRLRALPKPVVGSINGDAVGIGCSLALATDLRIASEAARFGVVFTRRGLGPDGGASALLRELVGTAKALELFYTGDIIGAEESLRLGLVNHVVPAEELEKATRELADRLAQGPTRAFGAAKIAVYASAHLSFESLLDLETRNQQALGRSHDVKEGISAFLERRTPEFRGR